MAKTIQYRVEVNTSRAEDDLRDVNNQLDDIQEKSKVDLLIESADAVKSVGDVRKAYRALRDAQIEVGEGTEEFTRLGEAAAGLQDKLNSVNEVSKDLGGSTLERLRNSLGRIREGIVNLDIDKVRQGFVQLRTVFGGLTTGLSTARLAAIGLGTALAATGVGAFVIAVTTLVSQFDDLASAGGLIGRIFTGINNIIEGFKNKVVDLADAWGLVDKNQTKAAKSAAEALSERIKNQNTLNGLTEEELKSEEGRAALIEKTLERLRELDDQRSDARKRSLKEEVEYYRNLRDIRDKEERENRKQSDEVYKELQKLQDERLSLLEKGNRRAVELLTENIENKRKERDELLKTYIKINEDYKIFLDAYSKLAFLYSDIIYDEEVKDIARRRELSLISLKERLLDKENYEEELYKLELFYVNERLKLDEQNAIEGSIAEQSFFDQSIKKRELYLQNIIRLKNLELEIEKEDLTDRENSQKEFFDKEYKLFEDAQNKKKALSDKINKDISDTTNQLFDDAIKRIERDIEREKELREKLTEFILQQELAKQQFVQETFFQSVNFNNALAGLVNQLYANEIAAAEGNFERQEELREESFEANKALQIANTVITTAQAVVNGLNAGLQIGGPWGIALGAATAAAAAATGAVQIATISATQYQPNGGGSGSSFTPSTFSAPTQQLTPNITFAGEGTGLNQVGAGSPNQFMNLSASVSISEINSVQNQVAVYETGSLLGGGG